MEPIQNSNLREKAAECFLSLEIGTPDPATRLRWRGWLAESQAHRLAFEACRAAWNAAAGASATYPTDLELLRDSYAGDRPIAEIYDRPLSAATLDDRRPRIAGSGWMVLAAASAAIAAVIATRQHPAPDQPTAPIAYETGRGEQRQLTLPDGSAITMGPRTHLEVHLMPAQRTFRLTTGEAIFTAAHDPARPFRVYAGAGWVEDIGTAFDVRSDPDHVTVTVIQGEVEVGTRSDHQAAPAAPVRLSRDQQVAYGETQGPVHTVDASQTTGWRDGQLAYIDQPLEQVVADLRRYSMKDIVLPDAAVGALRYTGTVSIDELDHWATGLARVYPVRIETLNDRLIIASKH